MSQITLERKVSGVLADATSVVLADSADAYGIKRNSDGAVMVAADTAVTHLSTGEYAYDTSLLDPTVAYTAAWKITNASWTPSVEYLYELILPVKPGLCTLADIEREFAMRIGPYERRTTGPGSVGKLIYIPKLKSTLDIGGYEDKYVLRRGFMAADGSPVAGFNADDRQRIVVSATLTDGFLTLDRDYNTPPLTGEDIEIHYLDPEQELRPVVLAALQEHVRLTDKTSVLLGSVQASQDITALCPWITELNQIWELSSTWSTSIYIPVLVDYWKPYMKDGHVWVTMNPIAYPNSLLIDHWRYAATLVNGAYSANGPDTDGDILYVNPKYAASAAHQLAFLYGSVRPRIMEASKSGLYISQDMAVSVFEDSARRHFKPGRKRQMLPGLLPFNNLVVNGPLLNP